MRQLTVILHRFDLDNNRIAGSVSLLFMQGDPKIGLGCNWEDQLKELERYILKGYRIKLIEMYN